MRKTLIKVLDEPSAKVERLNDGAIDAGPSPLRPDVLAAVTKAVQDNSYAALQGQKSVDQALKDMQAAITSATGG